MDATTARVVDFAMQAEFSALTPETVHECKRRLVDTFACAVGAYHEELSTMARAVAKRSSGDPAATVWGCTWPTTPEAAAFANGVMLHYLDMADTYFSNKAAGHPSDMISGIIAVAETINADGRSLINAITLAYDVFCTFCEAIDFNAQGWDSPMCCTLACAVGAGKLLGLSREQMANAIALAVTPNMALLQTRRGELSHWKGCAVANASRNAAFVAFLARDGFTGPTAVFEGKYGLWDVVGRFDWELTVGPGAPHRITRTLMKAFPIVYHAQSAAWAALEMRNRVRVEDIVEIRIETYQRAVLMCGTDPSRWAPKTHETADHSLPYIVAMALLDGEITSASFSEQRLADPAATDIMAKVKINEDADFSAQYPAASPCRLRIRTTSGQEIIAETKYPKGHIENPLSDSDLDAKFRGFFRSYGNQRQCEAALRALWNSDRDSTVKKMLQPFVVKTDTTVARSV